MMLPSPAGLLLALVVMSAAASMIRLDSTSAPHLSDSALPYEQLNEATPLLPSPLVNDMPLFLKYTAFDDAPVKAYLNSRDALLAEEPYFSAIVESAKEHNIHPLLLFAITGQEQGFVPKSSKRAKEMANNPFNVFHSWEDYNTDIRNSADIASKLLLKLAKSRPEGADPFEWFNRTYAEDPFWSEGVSKIFHKLISLPPSTS